MSSVSDRDVDQLKQTVATACRVLGALGATHATLGHVSARVPGADLMLIRGKGVDETALEYTDVDDIVTVDFDANVASARDGLRAPSESFIHTWLYRLNPEVQSVVHAHARACVLLTITGHELEPIGNYAYGSKLAIEGVPCYDYPFIVADDARGEEFATLVGTHPGALMRGHGITVVGGSVEEAVVRTLALEELASLTVDALAIGTPRLLTEAEREVLGRKLDPSRPRGTASEAGMIAGLWRYYLQASERPNR